MVIPMGIPVPLPSYDEEREGEDVAQVRLGTSPGFPQVLMSILVGILVGHVTRVSGSPVYTGL